MSYNQFSRGNEYRDYQEKNLKFDPDSSRAAASFLLDDHLLLAVKIELFTFDEQLKKELKGHELVIKDDWSLPFAFHYLFKSADPQLVLLFNIFIQKKKADGFLENLNKRWFVYETFSNGNQVQGSIFDDEVLISMCYVSLIGGSLMVLSCVFHCLRAHRRNVKEKRAVGSLDDKSSNKF